MGRIYPKSLPNTDWLNGTDYSLSYYFLLWLSLLVASVIFMLVHGIDYVSWPRLLPPTDAIYYSGPGYRSGNHGKGLKGRKAYLGMAKWLGNGRTRGRLEEVELGETKMRVD